METKRQECKEKSRAGNERNKTEIDLDFQLADKL